MLKFTAFLLLLVLFAQRSLAQTTNPYHLNGSASQENCNCYTLTPDLNTQSGSIWNINKINLNTAFDFKFNVFLGCSDAGADGIVFVLQPISTSVGSTGGGLGYEGVRPSIGITIDTWQNFENSDPTYDHIAIHRDGDISHTTSNNLAGPVPASPFSSNIEDCQWHTFRIVWDPVAKKLTAYIDGVERVSANVDLVQQIFGGNPMVFWGFTGATGGAKNHQRICTSLNPGFTFPPDQITCFPTPINFIDSSASFGTIEKWYWDFGDGEVDSSSAPPPHVYPQPGEYDVKLRILGNNGCVSEPFVKKVVVGSEPNASIAIEPAIVCDNSESLFIDASTVQFGTINRWNWVIEGTTFNQQSPSFQMPTNPQTVSASLQVFTKEGCISTLSDTTVEVLVSPRIDFAYSDECLGTTNVFTASSINPEVSISQWLWNFGDGSSGLSSSTTHKYRDRGDFAVSLVARAANGCISDTVINTVSIFGTKADAGRDTLISENQPLQLSGSGGEFYQWSPSTGLSDPNIPNPVASLARDISYILTTTSPEGCATSDTINVKVYKGPDIYVPNAFTPNGDGNNDKLRFIAAGITSLDFFEVYNRYGQLIYRSNRFDDGWDGTVNGKPQSSGTYVWMVRGKDFNGKIHVKKGTVTLLR